jgi:hypothetical protein
VTPDSAIAGPNPNSAIIDAIVGIKNLLFIANLQWSKNADQSGAIKISNCVQAQADAEGGLLSHKKPNLCEPSESALLCSLKRTA